MNLLYNYIYNKPHKEIVRIYPEWFIKDICFFCEHIYITYINGIINDFTPICTDVRVV